MLDKVTEEITGILPLPLRLTGVQWLICITASLGFAFDIYELLMMPLIVRPLLIDLGNLKPGSPEFNSWVGTLFYLPAVAGGIFGLLGGYLADRLGRRRVLMGSILLYSFSACAASFATSLPVLLILRCTTVIGAATEFVASIAWETRKQRQGTSLTMQARRHPRDLRLWRHFTTLQRFSTFPN